MFLGPRFLILKVIKNSNRLAKGLETCKEKDKDTVEETWHKRTNAGWLSIKIGEIGQKCVETHNYTQFAAGVCFHKRKKDPYG